MQEDSVIKYVYYTITTDLSYIKVLTHKKD